MHGAATLRYIKLMALLEPALPNLRHAAETIEEQISTAHATEFAANAALGETIASRLIAGAETITHFLWDES